MEAQSADTHRGERWVSRSSSREDSTHPTPESRRSDLRGITPIRIKLDFCRTSTPRTWNFRDGTIEILPPIYANRMADSIRTIVDSYDRSATLAEASTPPASWYTDSRILELEHRTVFTRSWQMVGRADQVREPGQYLTCQIAGEPILLIRGNDGILRGFFNVCRHHAAAVMTQTEGKAEHLRCPYHGWTYDLQGALIHTPEFGGVANFDRSANGLVPVQIAEWQHWLFAKLEPGGPSLKEYLGNDLLERFEPLNLEQFVGSSGATIRSSATGRSSSIIISMAATTCRISTAA